MPHFPWDTPEPPPIHHHNWKITLIVEDDEGRVDTVMYTCRCGARRWEDRD